MEFSSLVPATDILVIGEDANHAVSKNGGKIYKDQGDVIECDTPECDSALEVALHERVAERQGTHIAQHIATTYDMESRVLKRAGWASITDPRRPKSSLFEAMSTGQHENYATIPGHKFESEAALAGLRSFLVTRKAWTGAGMVTQTGYAIAQKTDATNYMDFGATATAHGNKRPWRIQSSRVELRDGDANMSEWVIRHKYALSSLALRLIGEGQFPHALQLANPTAAVRDIARNPNEPVQLAGGRVVTAMEHQYALYGAAMDMFGDELPPEEYEAYFSFETLRNDYRTIDLESPDVSAISDRIDWAAKLEYMLLQGLTPSDIHGGNFTALMYDLAWEDITSDNPARHWYQKYGNEQLTPAQIEHARTTPPDTRAARRVQLVRERVKSEYVPPVVSAHGWDTIRIDGEDHPLGTVHGTSPTSDI